MFIEDVFIGLGLVAGLLILGNILEERRAMANQKAQEKAEIEKMKNLRVRYVDVDKCGLLISNMWSNSDAHFYNLEGKRVSNIPESKRRLAKYFDCYLGQLLDSGTWVPVRRSDVEPRLQDAQFIKKHVCELISPYEVRRKLKRKREGSHKVVLTKSTWFFAMHPDALVQRAFQSQEGISWHFAEEKLRIAYTIIDGVLEGDFSVTHQQLGIVLLSAQFVGGEIHGQAERRGYDFRDNFYSLRNKVSAPNSPFLERLICRESYVRGCLVSRMEPQRRKLGHAAGVWSYEFLQEDRVAGEIAQFIELFMRGVEDDFDGLNSFDLSQAVASKFTRI